MVGYPFRAMVVIVCAALAGCTSAPDRLGYGGAVSIPDAPLQCVPYARARSHIDIYGDAYTWWDQAAGRYARSSEPSLGAVMVLYDYAGPDRAHVAVVRQVVGAREIRVDHANWLDDGAVYLDDPVQDVSADNDWSEVRVYNLKVGAWGGHVYPVRGFIGPGPDTASPRVAARPTDQIANLLLQQGDMTGGDN